MIILQTGYGDIHIELDYENAPNTATNFLEYAKTGFYNGTIFHRVIENFMIQGGGLTPEMKLKATRAPIRNEAEKAKSNKRGTIAMARLPEPHSATAQFFINTKDNVFLDYRSKTNEGWGYCVFGDVVEGMDVVDKINKATTGVRAGYRDVPIDDILINVKVLPE